MRVLDGPTKSLEVILNGVPSAQLPWVASWIDRTPRGIVSPGASDGVTNSVTAVTLVPAPQGDGFVREIEYLSVFNIANAARIVTIRLNNGVTTRALQVVTLQPGDHLIYNKDAGWRVEDSNGQIKEILATGITGMTAVERACTQRSLQSCLTKPGTAFLLVADVGYFVYLGRTVTPITPKYIESYLDVVGAGDTPSFELALLSSPAAPNKAAGQTLTVLTGTATTDSMTAGLGVKRNTGAFAALVPANTHLWAGCRANNAGTPTQPSLAGLMYDNRRGEVLVKTACGSIAAAGTEIAAVLATAQTSAAPVVNCPDLSATLD